MSLTPRGRRLAILLALTGCQASDSQGPTDPTGSSTPVVTTVVLSETTLSFTALSETRPLTAEVLDQHGAAMAGTVVSWSASDPGVADVSESGLVSAVANGSATITAAAGSASATATVTVQQTAATIALSPSPLELAGVGDTATVTASVMDPGGSAITEPSLSWSSGDAAVATVEDGLVTATGSGSTTVTASAETGGSPVVEAVPVTIQNGVLAVPGGGQISIAAGVATLDFPPGALTEPTFITAEPATGLPAEPEPVPATALDFGPDGIVFGAPVTLGITYDQTLVAPAFAEEDLRLYELVDDVWLRVAESAVDPAGHTVFGAVEGFSVFAALPRLTFTTEALPAGVANAPYQTSLSATGGGGPYEWTITAGALPDGLTLDVSTGAITGTPAAAGTSEFTARVASGGEEAERALSITVTASLSILTSSLPDGTQNVDYGTQTLMAAGGDGSYAWSLTSGSLPDGLSLSVGGEITGAPTAIGRFDFTVMVGSDGETAQGALSILVTKLVLQPDQSCGDYFDEAIASFGDAALGAAVRSALGLGPQDDVTCGVAATLTSLTADDSGIASLSGAQNLTGLTDLGLYGNAIVDIAPLSDLAALSSLVLRRNAVIDLEPLVGLVNLTDLALQENQITEVGALGGLPSLSVLGLNANPGLANIQPLLDNPGLGSGDVVGLTGTSVSCTDVSALQAKGVTVAHDCALASVTVLTQPSTEALSGLVLEQQPSVEVRDALGDLAVGVSVQVSLASGDGALAGSTSVTTDATGVATFGDLSITGSPGVHTLSFSASGVEATSGPVHVAYAEGTYLDVTYCGTQVMDVYVPSNALARPLPLAVFTHGGAWWAGDKSEGATFPRVRDELLTRGYVVVSVNYRLATESTPWPAQIHDVKCAIRHLRAEAGDYGFDGVRIGAWGYSAGGHLTAMLGVTDASSGFEGNEGYAGWSSRVEAAALVSPITDLTQAPTHPEINFYGPEVTFTSWPGPSVELTNASPITWASADDPPFFIAYGTADDVVLPPQSPRLGDALNTAGASATLLEVTNGGHDLQDAGQGTPTPDIDEVAQLIADFLDAHVLGP